MTETALSTQLSPFLESPITFEDEQLLLSLVIRDKDVTDAVLDPDVLRATDFYNDEHSTIYTAIRSLKKSGEDITLMSVYYALKERKAVNEAAYLFSTLIKPIEYGFTTEDIAIIIKKLQQRRRAAELQDLQRNAIAAIESGDPVQINSACNALIAAEQQTTTKPKKTLLTLTEAYAIPATKWLVDKEIPERDVVMLYGSTGSLKTFIALNYALTLATQGKRVIYVTAEDLAGVMMRIRAWCIYNKVKPETLADSFFVWPEPFDLMNGGTDIFINEVASLKPAFIVIDTLAKSMVGANENSSQDMGIAISNAERIVKATEATVMLIHHSGKDSDKGARGSSSLPAGVNTSMRATFDKSIGGATLECEKLKNAALFPAKTFQLVPVDGTDSCIVKELSPCRVDLRLSQLAKEILSAIDDLEGSARHKDILSHMGKERGDDTTKLNNAFKELKALGFVVKQRTHDPYTLTDKGKKVVLAF